VTFFKVGIAHLSATYFSGESVLFLDLPGGLNLDTSTLATQFSASNIGLVAPVIDMKLIPWEAEETQKYTVVGRLSTSLSVDIYTALEGWEERASRQQEFIKAMDMPTKRIQYMYGDQAERHSERIQARKYLPTAQDGSYDHNVYLPHPRSNTLQHSDDDDGSDTTLETFPGDESGESTSTDSDTCEEEGNVTGLRYGATPVNCRSLQRSTGGV
jgi:hypothetical protein